MRVVIRSGKDQRLPLSLAATTTLVVVAAVLLGCAGNQSSPEAAATNPWRDLALFRREPGPADSLPPRLLPAELAARLALDPSAARLAYAGTFNRIYAVPGRQAICLFDTTGASSPCWPPATVREGMAVSTSFCPPSLPPRTMEMVGLLPDGIHRVSIVMEDGHRRSAQVTHNLFLLDLPYGRSLPTRLIWHRGGKVHNQIAGISPRIARLSCAAGGIE